MNKISKPVILLQISLMILFSHSLHTSASLISGQAGVEVIGDVEDTLHHTSAETETDHRHQNLEYQASKEQEGHEVAPGEEHVESKHAEGEHQSNMYPLLFIRVQSHFVVDLSSPFQVCI